jgi:hypothetical protein
MECLLPIVCLESGSITMNVLLNVLLKRLWLAALLTTLLAGPFTQRASSEVVLQYFNTSWQELAYKMPELAEAGYTALWLPPPTKGSGGLSVGYDLWDPFDIGNINQRNTVRTRYGTEADLHHLIRVAHRFGMRVYVDNIMNHRAFDVPGFDEYTPIDVYPGMVPEDFHLRVTEEGFYRKWDNVANWSDTWQIQNRNFSDLIDIAQEAPDNGNFGTSEGDHMPKIKLVRHPDNPEYYAYAAGSNGAVYVGFGVSNGLTNADLTDTDNAWLYEEDVNAYLIRAARWLVAHTKIDGLRLDAVKHVPDYFFGQQSGDKDGSNAGYCGGAQEQFNLTRGFSDWNNHRDSVFSTEVARDDLMMFGEHLGEPPGLGGYIDAGMRLVDSKLHSFLNGNLGQPWGNLEGLQHAGGNGFSSGSAVMFAKSHDDDYSSRPELQFALYMTREGLPNVYTDGNYQAETLGESGGAFPRHSNIAFLGQFGDSRIPNLNMIHNHFSRGYQEPRWADGDVVAYERIDKRENSSMPNADGATLFFAMNDDYSAGAYREIPTSFPAGAKLWQYADGGGHFYYTVENDYSGFGNGMFKVIIPPGGYFVFSWRSPEASDLWAGSGGNPVTIYDDGAEVSWMSYERKDGPDGDPGFNPYGAPDSDPTDFKYTHFVPRVTSGTNLRFVVRTDGSAVDTKLKLDGGIDLNNQSHALGDTRDNPPGIHGDGGQAGSVDMFLGYESMDFVQRQYREKFASRDTDNRNVIGSAGAETYEVTIGSPGFTVLDGATGRDSDEHTAEWIFHDPEVATDNALDQFWPAPTNAIGTNIFLWVKVGFEFQISDLVLYYTVDGQTFPEGAGGEGRGNTRTVALQYDHKDATNGTVDWYTGEIPAQPDGTVLRYKIGGFKQQNGDTNAVPHVPFYVAFPNSDFDIGIKKSMMGAWELDGFNADTVTYHPHNDYGETETGLDDGFHILRARTFLERTGRASIYNTFIQPFYYDTQTPSGEVVFPNENDTLNQNEYGVVARTDETVTEVWYLIVDTDAANDDGQTGDANGNGIITNGVDAWVQATSATPSQSINSSYPLEWRFSYRNIPSGSSPAQIKVRFLELSSSTNMTFNDVQGHFTTVTRNVLADAPLLDLFFDWPTQDGTAVQAGWEIRVRFTKSLADGLTESQLRDRFLIRIDGNAQGKDLYTFAYNVSAEHHELRYDLPDLFNGDPDYPHQIRVTHTTGGGVNLEASRFVIAPPADQGAHIDIVQPLEFDSDGKAFEIVLPDLANPEPTDRQFLIRVETDLSAQYVWLVFTNSVGTTTPLPAVSNALPGRVSVQSGSADVIGTSVPLVGTLAVTETNALVIGTGTTFSNTLSVGRSIGILSNAFVVTHVDSDVSLNINPVYPGPSASNLTGRILPAFDDELRIGQRFWVAGHESSVASIPSSSNMTLSAVYAGASMSNVVAYALDGNPSVSGNRMYWHFLWTDMQPGRFTFFAYVNTNSADTATQSGFTVRNTTVILREQATNDVSDLDDDDDGLYDTDETTPQDLPDTNPETWNNGDVHVWQVYGRTDPLLPDTDGDLLPDGLESGWRVPIDPAHTNPNEDTNGDGFNNFRADLDPPFYNTVPDNNGLPEYVFNGSRTRLIHGSLTDPGNPDSDYDGIRDGIEDWNRNGWADGDGVPLQPTTGNPSDDRPGANDWPDGEWGNGWANFVGRETDPNKGDTDEDGAIDGYGEDKDFDGWIGGDVNSNRVHEAGETWWETDPLNPDTDGDGLPDGWEAQFAFDGLDAGVVGVTNLRGVVTASLEHGPNGNPDNDFLVVGGVTSAYVNVQEFQNGTHPRRPEDLPPPTDVRITIGPGPQIGTLGGMPVFEEFRDWIADDCLALDEYEGSGNNNQGGDLYLGWDGWDTSRDIVAFYANDGGDPGSGGDGKFYFRVDFHDLQALAEEGNLDVYVVIDTGNPALGEMTLPEDVDAITHNRWEAVVAVYESGQGTVYVDEALNNNSTTFGEDLAARGVVPRGPNAANGFIDAYFNATLDAVEFSISRQALLDAGYAGNPDTLNFQVYTTKDGTGNNPQGAGDIGGRNDVRDSIFNDNVSEDYFFAQQGLESILRNWITGDSRCGRAKIGLVVHGNQAVQPGSVIQDLINDGAAAGYHRLLDAHEAHGQALNLHVTATLAMALQWAAADPADGVPWRDGPTLNAQIKRLVGTNIVSLLGSTYSDHMLPYFTKPFNRDNEQLARSVLESIYDTTIVPADTVFWTPERLLDADVYEKILDMGYGHTVMDQDTHLFNWYGRTESLIEGAYRLNRISGVNNFVINAIPTAALFEGHDNGVSMSLRALMSRKARSGTQDQIITLFSGWEAWGDVAKADVYDRSLRWMANRPWVQVASLNAIAQGALDAWGDSAPDTWGTVARSDAGLTKQAHNWLNHASDSNFDNWYVGSAQEQSLINHRSAVRAGITVPTRWGMMFADGVILDAWNAVQTIADSGLSQAARAVLHASVFQTAFHNEGEHDLRRFSIGTYIAPASGSNTLAQFALAAQAQTRKAMLYTRVDDWDAIANSVVAAQVAAEDVDADGEDEYLLYNDRLFLLFERIGGRVVAAWARSPLDGNVVQVAGNFVAYAGREEESEGTSNLLLDGTPDAYRASLLKDWWVDTGGGGTAQYNNDLYSAVSVTNGWLMTSSDGAIAKRVTLMPHASGVSVSYVMSGALAGKTLYIRNGFVPSLNDLLLEGQRHMGVPVATNGVLHLRNTNYVTEVDAYVLYGVDGHNSSVNSAAVDDNPGAAFELDTLNMRNLAHMQQVELFGTGSFSFELGFVTRGSDWDGDGVPNTVEDATGFLSATNGADGALDEDEDGMSNADEFVAGTGMGAAGDVLRMEISGSVSTGVVVRFPGRRGRFYDVSYTDASLVTPSWTNATPVPRYITADGIQEWIDDGVDTDPAPWAVTQRLYRIDMSLP